MCAFHGIAEEPVEQHPVCDDTAELGAGSELGVQVYRIVVT